MVARSQDFIIRKNVVKQDSVVTIGGKQYRVRLIKGAGDNPTDSYTNTEALQESEWNDLIFHYEHKGIGLSAYAKNNWGYS